MKKLANFIVDKRYFVMAFVVLLMILCAFLAQQVEINSDLTKYLADDSAMKIGMDVMGREFAGVDSVQTIRVMFQDLDTEQKSEMLSRLKAIEYVDSVDYDPVSADYNRDNYTLYIVNTRYAYGSDEEISIENTLKEDFKQYGVVYQNDDTALAPFPLWIILAALVLLLIILLVMCNSWIEPFLFLAAIGVAVVINSGTNIILGTISNVTSSIASILQLSLSMDYSIILMNRYRQECEQLESRQEAMKAALSHAFSAITSSSLTTIVGLLALAFMRFKIGFDLGFVLAKGVLISMLCIFTLLPGMILACDKLIQKTGKKEIHISMNKIAAFSYRFRYVLSFVFVILFVGSYILQGKTETVYTLNTGDPIADVFPSANMLLIVYDNDDEEQMGDIVEELEEDSNINQITAYSNTLGKPYTPAQLAEAVSEMGGDMNLDASLLNMLYYAYYADGEPSPMTAEEFLQFVSGDVMENEAFSAYIDEDIRENMDMIRKFADAENLTSPMSASGLADFFGLNASDVSKLLLYYSMQNGDDAQTDPAQAFLAGLSGQKLSVQELVDFLTSDVLTDEAFSGQFSEDDRRMLAAGKTLIDAVVDGKTYNAGEMSELLSGISDELDSSMMELLYLYHAGAAKSDPEWTLTISALADYLSENVLNDERFAAVIDEDMRNSVADMRKQLDDAAAQLQGPEYSRLIVSSVYPEESAETTEFFDRLTAMCEERLTGNYYLIGNSAMSYEMQQTFRQELLFITLLTSIAIFIVVALTFFSIIIPAALVLIVQCGVYITISVVGLQGYSIYYLALIIVECMLMGATIDYGILFTNYYREMRQKNSVKEALQEAYNGSIHTILTSGLILILVTGIIGYCVSDPTIGQICRTISTGALSATLLILFILPGLLSTFDRLITRRNRK